MDESKTWRRVKGGEQVEEESKRWRRVTGGGE